MQTIQASTIPAGTLVQTSDGRRAITLDNTVNVRNSETGQVTSTNRIKFTEDDEWCPGEEQIRNVSELSVVTGQKTLRLMDGNGYTIRVCIVAQDEIDATTIRLLKVDAVQDANQWKAFGFDADARDYRVA